MKIPVKMDVDRDAKRISISLNGDKHELALNELSDWITLTYHAAPGIKVQGICCLYLL